MIKLASSFIHLLSWGNSKLPSVPSRWFKNNINCDYLLLKYIIQMLLISPIMLTEDCILIQTLLQEQLFWC